MYQALPSSRRSEESLSQPCGQHSTTVPIDLVSSGKRDEHGEELVPIRGELDPDRLRPMVRKVLGLEYSCPFG